MFLTTPRTELQAQTEAFCRERSSSVAVATTTAATEVKAPGGTQERLGGATIGTRLYFQIGQNSVAVFIFIFFIFFVVRIIYLLGR